MQQGAHAVPVHIKRRMMLGEQECEKCQVGGGLQVLLCIDLCECDHTHIHAGSGMQVALDDTDLYRPAWFSELLHSL